MQGKERFTGKALVYEKYRPTYGEDSLTNILSTCGILPNKNTVVADIGSGTGKFTKLLLDRGFTVYSIEPNKEMRQIAEAKFANHSTFNSMDAIAENTGLKENSVSLITVAQAFHYFDLEKTKQEFKRILKPGGKVALLWNFRQRDSDFIREYEDIIYSLHSDKVEPTHAQDKMTDELFRQFFAKYQTINIPNMQEFNFEGLWGRTLSNNHMPNPNEDGYNILYSNVRELFNKYCVNGKVVFPYNTKIIVGELEREKGIKESKTQSCDMQLNSR